MNITSLAYRRPFLCALAGGLLVSTAAAQPKNKVPKALPVEEPRVYIVEDPVVPQGTQIIRPRVVEAEPEKVEVRPKKKGLFDNDDDEDRRARSKSTREVEVIEVTPAPAPAPVAPPEVTRHTTSSTTSSSSKAKSRGHDSEKGKTQYLETPADAPQVQEGPVTTSTTATSSNMKSETQVGSEPEPSVNKKSTTVRTRSSERENQEDSKGEVQRLQEKVKRLEAQTQVVKEDPPAAAPGRRSGPSVTVVPETSAKSLLPVTPLPTTADVRQPLPEPIQPSRTTVTQEQQQQQVTTQKIEDTPPPSQSPVVEAPVSRVNGDPLDTTPAPGSTPETAVSENAPASFPKVETQTIEDPAARGPGANAVGNANVKEKEQAQTSTTATRTKVETKKPVETEKTAGNEKSAEPGKPAGTKEAPVAEKTETSGLVKSPYPPHKLIDVRGMASGSLAKDPTTQEIFRVP